MDYFSKFIRKPPEPTVIPDHAAEFNTSWKAVEETLFAPDERQISRGIQSTSTPGHLKSMTDALVRESTQYDNSTGPCLEYLLKHDLLNMLVRLSEADRPFGIQAEVLRMISNLVVMLDERFLVHTAVHKAVIRLLQACMGDEITEFDAGTGKAMGAAGSVARLSPSEYEEDLVNLLCILCGRIRTYPELLIIFFHDKNWITPPARFTDDDLADIDEGEEMESLDVEGDDNQHSSEKETSGADDTDSAFDTHATATPTPHNRPLADPDTLRRSISPSSRSMTTSENSAPISTGPIHHHEFLIFNYLLRFIHREGTVGDFARAGLLFLIDIAMTSQESALSPSTSVQDIASALAEYILEGDFSEVLAAGLGAVYTLLPYKLEMIRDASSAGDSTQVGGGMEVGTSTLGTLEEEKRRVQAESSRVNSLGADVSSSLEFRARLDHFLKMVGFVQDVLNRVDITINTDHQDEGSSKPASEPLNTVGRAIALAILENIRLIFLQNVLYPSILECSALDGSAVAVMAYIDVLLDTLQAGRLATVLLEFLMSDDDDAFKPTARRRAAISSRSRDHKRLKRRSSAMVLLSIEAPQSTGGPSEYFTSLGRFTLKDLLIDNMGADRAGKGLVARQTGIAGLTLLQNLVACHCRETVAGLLTVLHDPLATDFPTPLPSINPFQGLDAADPGPHSDSDDDEFVYPGASPQSLRSPRRTKLKPAPRLETLSQPSPSIQTLEAEKEMYLKLLPKINPDRNHDSFSTGFDKYLKDSVQVLQSHCCYMGCDPSLSMQYHNSRKHVLRPSDPVIGKLIHNLRTFFAHSPEYNITLAGVVLQVTACPYRSVAGWLRLVPKDASEDPWAIQQQASPDANHDFSKPIPPIDQDISDRLRSERRNLPFDPRLRQAKSMPILYTILSGLVRLLDRYRAEVDNFDDLLRERRDGLMFSETLNQALSLPFNPRPDAHVFSSPSSKPTSPSVPPSAPAAVPSPKPKKGGVFFVTSLLTPKRKTALPTQTTPSTPRKNGRVGAEVAASPFATHYRKTVAVDVPAYIAPSPTEGPWVFSTHKSTEVFAGLDEDDVFTSRTVAPIGDVKETRIKADVEATVSLSTLLDNVVVLEEVIKELAAAMQARVSLGFDDVRYI